MAEQRQVPANRYDTLKALIESQAGKFAEVAPEYLNVKRITRLVLASVSRNQDVLACTPESVLLFCMKMCECGFEAIGPGGAWPVPFWNNKTNKQEVVFIPDYRGLLNQAVRFQMIRDYDAPQIVRAKDVFRVCHGLHPILEHEIQPMADRGEMIGAYIVYTKNSGERGFCYMSREEIVKIKNNSKAKSGPWAHKDWEERMWCKTVCRRAMNTFQGGSKRLDKIIKHDDDAVGVDFDATKQLPNIDSPGKHNIRKPKRGAEKEKPEAGPVEDVDRPGEAPASETSPPPASREPGADDDLEFNERMPER